MRQPLRGRRCCPPHAIPSGTNTTSSSVASSAVRHWGGRSVGRGARMQAATCARRHSPPALPTRGLRGQAGAAVANPSSEFPLPPPPYKRYHELQPLCPSTTPHPPQQQQHAHSGRGAPARALRVPAATTTAGAAREHHGRSRSKHCTTARVASTTTRKAAPEPLRGHGGVATHGGGDAGWGRGGGN